MHGVTFHHHRRSTTGPTTGHLDCVVTKVGESWESSRGNEAWGEAVHHGHARKIEASRSTGWHVVIIDRKMSVAVGIRARRGNVSRIEDVGVDKVQLG